MMELKDILYKSGIIEAVGDTRIPIVSVQFDSRMVSRGTLFVAVAGTKTDGHRFISNAIESGASAVVCEVMPSSFQPDITYIRVKNSAVALGIIASNFSGNPSSKLRLVGITGTNGKTTTATLTHSLFRMLGYGAGLISTVENKINDQVIPATHTTPDALALNTLLEGMVKAGCEYCFMEVSSHAVVQERIAGIVFAGGVFTNLTHDHLDFHLTFNEYLKAKKRFFDELPPTAFALTNNDDRNGTVMVQNTRAKVKTYGLRTLADFHARLLEEFFEGTKLIIAGTEVWVKLVGRYNAYNCLAVFAIASLIGIPENEILTCLSQLRPVEGRFDYLVSPSGIVGIIDYAHTPDALKNVLETINDLLSSPGRVITVVGAGGDRDRSKRPEMAQIACDYSDKVILTSDNPRTEDPLLILEDMKQGLDIRQMKKTLVISDRREAIRTACQLAGKGDVVLVAGKGHEKYQEIQGVRYPMDDKSELEDALGLEPMAENDKR